MNPSTDHLQTETLQQLELLGYKDGDAVFYRAIKKNSDDTTELRKIKGVFPTIPLELGKLSTGGFNLYFVVNGGGDKDIDVTECKAVFYEHDDRPKEDSLFLWQTLGLPEPTFQIDTGGKSIHSYWVFEQPITVELWETLQTDLLNYSDGDRSLKNESRIMRLAGYKHQGTGELASIISKSGIKYEFDDLRSIVPVAAPKPKKEPKPKTEKVAKQKPTRPQGGNVISMTIPIERLLTKAHRDILGGVHEGSRDCTGLELACDLIGVELLGSIECDYCGKDYKLSIEQNARDLFSSYCHGCNPPLPDGDEDRIWDSAQNRDRLPSIQDDEALKNCARSFLKDTLPNEEVYRDSPVTEEDQRRCPYFETSPQGGLWRVSLTTDDENEGKMKRVRERIGNHLDCVAYVNNPDSNGAALYLEFKSIRGGIVKWSMDRGYIVSDTGVMLSELMKRGYHFKLSYKKVLIDYLNSLGADVSKTYTLVEQTGWVGSRYVSQHKTYGEGDLVFRDIEPSSEVATEIKGTLDDWKTNVAAKCDHNSRLIFVLGVAFAAPLLPVVGLESGGFHFMGDTSTGKTTAAKVAVSVTGEKIIPNWRSTSNGLESIAGAHNHSLLALDEIGQADEKSVGDSTYMLRNGQGKTRMTKNLTNRKAATWDLIFLSTGENSLASYMAIAGKVQKGGQEVGLPDIPAVPNGSPFGLFESIHGVENSKVFAEKLEADCKKYRGTAIDEFLTRLVIDRQDKAFDGLTAGRVFKASKKLAEGTIDHAVSRVANRFGLVQVGLELAHSYGILPFPFDRIEWAVKKMFDDWLTSRGGDGSIEIKKACDRIRHLIVTNEHSDRVFDPRKNDGQIVRNLLGYKVAGLEGETLELLIPTTVFDKELCDGVNKSKLIAELQVRGWLTPPGGDGKSTHARRVNSKLTRFLVFQPLNMADRDFPGVTGVTGVTAAEIHTERDSNSQNTVTPVNSPRVTGVTAAENIEDAIDIFNVPEGNDGDLDILTDF
jgi:hypothetical protein